MNTDPKYTFRAGDVVHHAVSGEEWILATDEFNGKVQPCGWPESIAEASHCIIVIKASDQERLDMLKTWAETGKGHEHERDSRTREARRQLTTTMNTDPCDLTPVTPCCKKPFETANYPVFYNLYNKVVQCHACGHRYDPAPPAETKVETPTDHTNPFDARPEPVAIVLKTQNPLIERLFDEHGNLLHEKPYILSRLFTKGQNQVVNSVSMTTISCELKDGIVTTVCKLHGTWPDPFLPKPDSDIALQRNPFVAALAASESFVKELEAIYAQITKAMDFTDMPSENISPVFGVRASPHRHNALLKIQEAILWLNGDIAAIKSRPSL